MSRPLPASIRPVLAFLIPLLASDRDGEALGAARAIERKLVAAGLDFHDLAAVVAGTSPAVLDITPDTAASPRPKSKRAETWRPPVSVELDDERRGSLLAALSDAVADARLRHFDRLDCLTLIARLERGTPPTEKMLERAERIFDGLRGAA